MQSTDTTYIPQTFRFSRASSNGGGMATIINPSKEQHEQADEGLQKLAMAGANKTKAVEFLLGLGWSVSAICQKIVYETDTLGHKAGDPMKVQHANQIKQKWLAAKNAAAAPNADTKVQEPNKNGAPVPNLVKSTDAKSA